LGKAGNKTFDSASQHFFWAGEKFLDECLQIGSQRAPPLTEDERTLRFPGDA
jgi:hypothetical protein